MSDANVTGRQTFRSRDLSSVTMLVAIFVLRLFVASALADQKPNIVLILADDQGWGDLSINGNTNLQTPNIDRLATSGASFDRFFVCPVCSPTRAELLTGRYHPRGGIRGVTSGGERLNLSETTLAQVFKKAGYTTGAFGKWHNGTQYPYHPNARGFDEYYGFTSGHWGDYFDPPLDHNGKPVQGQGYITDDLTNHAISFIKENRDRPFFCYVPYNTPHSPFQVPDRYFEKFKNAELTLRANQPAREKLDATRAVLAMCENLDWNVGRLLQSLDELELARNTIVLYLTDNGPNGQRWNGGMRGSKGSTDEGGVRSPLFVRWPGQIKPGTQIDSISGAIDLLPTLADLARIPLQSPKPLDGVSLAPLLRGQVAEHDRERLIFSHWNDRVSVRSQSHRLDADGRLYNLVQDPGQSRDLSRNDPKTAARLARAVEAWKADVLAGIKAPDDRPFPAGYSEWPIAVLPARDGTPHGEVHRSARAPNCSFFTNWTSPADSMTWDIEIHESGQYEAAIYYTCPKMDIGSEIELNFGKTRLQTKVADPHDPPLRGNEHDRASRGAESLVKDFKRMSLGRAVIEAGRGPLTLRALSVAGRQVADVRAVELVRVGPSTAE